MSERALRDDEQRAVFQALRRSSIAAEDLCRDAVRSCRLIPFNHLLPPVTQGPRPVIAFFALRRRASGITLGRRVFIRQNLFGRTGNLPPALLVHEVAHVVQFLRDGTVPFLTRYISEYLGARLRGLADREAYLSISYEEEARYVETFHE